MREIKFRAWNHAQSEMVEFNNEKLCRDEYQRQHLARLMAGRYGDVLMQYTGLKDVNGVDIYEGDIVTAHQFLFDGDEVESTILGQIGSNEFGWTLTRIKSRLYEEHTGYAPFEGESNLGDFYGLHEESFEVIGNIHQTPELLNDMEAK